MNDAITFLGTSDGLPTADRHHASLLVRLAGGTILLDCGEPCSHSLKRIGVDFNSIDAVFVSHAHSDHIAGLPMLIQSMWLEARRRPLPLWMPRRVIRPLQSWLRTCFLFETQFKFRIQWRPLSVTAPARAGKIRVSSFRTTHLEATRKKFARRHPAVGFDIFCFLLEANGRRIGYSADLGNPRDLEPLLRRPLDLLVVELAHFHPNALAEFLRDKPVRHVIITHMGRAVRARFDDVQRRLTSSLRPRRVTFAVDGDVIKF
jgi:ribonuclease Z